MLNINKIHLLKIYDFLIDSTFFLFKIGICFC